MPVYVCLIKQCTYFVMINNKYFLFYPFHLIHILDYQKSKNERKNKRRNEEWDNKIRSKTLCDIYFVSFLSHIHTGNKNMEIRLQKSTCNSFLLPVFFSSYFLFYFKFTQQNIHVNLLQISI